LSGLRTWFRCLGAWRLALCFVATLVVISIELAIGNHVTPELDEAGLAWLGDVIPPPLGRALVVVYVSREWHPVHALAGACVPDGSDPEAGLG